MDTLPFPPRPNLDQYRKRAKRLVGGDRADDFTLADAQFLIAEAHGFENWAAFARHIGGDAELDQHDAEFERAADAIVDGDLETLAALVRANPKLVRERSSRVHHITLLQYAAANGVETSAKRRRRTPWRSRDFHSTPGPRLTRSPIPMVAVHCRPR